MSLQDLLIQQEIINDLKAKLAIAVEALEIISNTDYRGNRSNESVRAFNALKKIKP